MKEYLQLFKEDFFSGVFKVTKGTAKNMLLAYLIYYGAAMIIGVLFMLIAFLGSMDMTYFTEALMNGATEETSLIIAEQIIEMLNTPEFIVSFSIMILIMMLLASWQYFIAFNISNNEIKREGKSFKDLLKGSFSIGVLKLLLLILVINIIMTVMFAGALYSISLNGYLALLLVVIAFILSMRLVLVLPAYVVGNYDFGSAFSYSFYHVGWTRAIKFLGICIIAFILMFIAALVIAGISFVFSLIPFVGVIVQMAVNIAFNALILAITVNSLSGLFYRYFDASQLAGGDAETKPLPESV